MKPSDLPAVRDGMARWVRTQTPGAYGAANAALLDAARLYWVTAPMREEAATFAEHEIYESRWTEDDRPAPCGLMLVEDGIADVPFLRRRRLIQATAVAWTPVQEGLALTYWSPREQVVRLLGKKQRRLPPLVMVASVQQPVEQIYRPTVDLAPIWRAPVALLQAAWLLMASTLTTSTTLPQAPTQTLSTSQHARHSAHHESAVTIIHIRQPPARADTDGHEQHHYHHRWRVRPHKRWVHCGPDHADLRRVPVRGHVKGPPGAPWVHHTQVTVWDR